MKHMAKKAKTAIKKWDFRGKTCVIGALKKRVGHQTRKAKWCKTQVPLLKTDKTKDVKGQKQHLFTYFSACILARTKKKREQFCKINNNNFRQ